mmetsp:Transcript_11169/g.23830  ORF Transcript_11169/g.23830 Transcript_11169/m.23830 type:complete len:206 (+) Transcript_11169:123-740(+)
MPPISSHPLTTRPPAILIIRRSPDVCSVRNYCNGGIGDTIRWQRRVPGIGNDCAGQRQMISFDNAICSWCVEYRGSCIAKFDAEVAVNHSSESVRDLANTETQTNKCAYCREPLPVVTKKGISWFGAVYSLTSTMNRTARSKQKKEKYKPFLRIPIVKTRLPRLSRHERLQFYHIKMHFYNDCRRSIHHPNSFDNATRARASSKN